MGSLSIDPLFVDVTAGDYHLMEGSLLIDVGTSMGAPSHDFEHDSRPWDGDEDGNPEVDMGADEFRIVPYQVDLPVILRQVSR